APTPADADGRRLGGGRGRRPPHRRRGRPRLGRRGCRAPAPRAQDGEVREMSTESPAAGALTGARTDALRSGGVGESPRRPDGTLKVKGEFAFSSDLWMDGMLWGLT